LTQICSLQRCRRCITILSRNSQLRLCGPPVCHESTTALVIELHPSVGLSVMSVLVTKLNSDVFYSSQLNAVYVAAVSSMRRIYRATLLQSDQNSVRLSISLSVCHAAALCRNSLIYNQTLVTTWQPHHCSFLTSNILTTFGRTSKTREAYRLKALLEIHAFQHVLLYLGNDTKRHSFCGTLIGSHLCCTDSERCR